MLNIDAILSEIAKHWFSILNLIIVSLLALYFNQKKSNLEKEIEKLKASHEKEFFIHKLQFEKEFEIYEYLWMKISHFKKALHFFSDPNDKKSIDDLADNISEVLETINNNIPFYSEDIFKNANRIIEISRKPLLLSVYNKNIDREELEKLEKEIIIICADIEKAIRQRINNIGSAKLIE